MRETDRTQQTARDRRFVVEEAGLHRLSLWSVLAGTLTAYGAFAIVAAIVGGILTASEVDTDFSTNDWSSTGAIGGLATGFALLLAYLFGGYVAGRMARRAGLLHGAAVAVLSIIGGAIAGALISALADSDEINRNLGSIGVPTTWDEWNAVTATTAIVALGAVVVGAVAGGLLGDRWHARLLARAADPDRGISADTRRRAEELEAERDRLVERELHPVGAPSDSESELERQQPVEQPPAPVQSDQDPELDRSSIDLRSDRSDDEPRYTAAEWEDARSARDT